MKVFFVLAYLLLPIFSFAMEQQTSLPQSVFIQKILIATLPTKNIYLHVRIPENFRYVDLGDHDICLEYIPETDLKKPGHQYSEVISIGQHIFGKTTAQKEWDVYCKHLKLNEKNLDMESVKIFKEESIKQESYQKKAGIVSYTHDNNPEIAYICFYSNGTYHTRLSYAIVCNTISKTQALEKLEKFENQNISRHFKTKMES